MAKQSERNGRRDRHGNRRAGADCRCGRCRRKKMLGEGESRVLVSEERVPRERRSRGLNPLFAIK